MRGREQTMLAQAKAKRTNVFAVETDNSWQRFALCRACGRRICINNNSDRSLRPSRKLGVVCCAWCSEQSVRFYLATTTHAKLLRVPKEHRDDEWKAKMKRLRKMVEALCPAT